MSYKIDDSICIGCGLCEGECPVGAIAPSGDVYAINADECLDCGACAGSCPQEAISEE